MRYILPLAWFAIFISASCHKNHLNQTDPWQKLTSPFGGQLLDIQFIGNDTGYVLGLNTEIANRYNVLLRTIDKGKTWSQQIFPEPEPGGVGVLFSYNSHLLLAAKDGIFKSTDEGKSWVVTDTNYNTLSNLTKGIYFFDPENGITIKGGVIYKTIDGAKHFNEVYYHPSGYPIQELQFISNGFGFARAGDFRSGFSFFLKTTDKGNTWSNSPFNYGFINTMFFINENIGYCLVSQDIYKTVDAGNTWTKKNDQSVGQNNGGKLFFINEEEGFLMTAYGEIYYTANGGKKWILEHLENGLQLNDISVDKSNNVFVVGQNGLILLRNHH